MVVQTQRGIQTDTVDPMVFVLSVQTPRNVRDPFEMTLGQVNTQPPTTVHGVTSPLTGFTPGVQETGNTSTKAEQTTPGTEISSTTNT
uniref:Uncharacterized protein n=1 Tax=Cannabis sativa TaxID=3483 RepID=A0A803Q8X0_CANSA